DVSKTRPEKAVSPQRDDRRSWQRTQSNNKDFCQQSLRKSPKRELLRLHRLAPIPRLVRIHKTLPFEWWVVFFCFILVAA
ncbi:MAG: hypothetical protein JXB30_10590, partial [Anaerolineae bacterium]|nr:hypothetical protein [Anaerolineae bacterium]